MPFPSNTSGASPLLLLEKGLPAQIHAVRSGWYLKSFLLMMALDITETQEDVEGLVGKVTTLLEKEMYMQNLSNAQKNY
eukprot:8228744-Ditylum_brightwellii.AAC.2